MVLSHYYCVQQMSLSRIQSLRLAAVLEDCSDQLDILGHALTVQISRERSSAPAQVSVFLLCSCSLTRGTSGRQLLL